jgi:hypothetical protein
MRIVIKRNHVRPFNSFCFPVSPIKALFLTLVLAAASSVAQNQPPANPVQPESTWHFAVSGDSRNCGDVVMPTIADDVRKQNAAFYWHLGDFRWMSAVDEDMRCGPNHLDGLAGHIEYGLSAWRDFRENQVASFGPTPFFLGIGNHEMVFHHDRDDYLRDFAEWLDSPVLRAQRLNDNPEDRGPHSYYHWIDRGIDFITLDNASEDEFSEVQLKWFRAVLARDLSDTNVKTVVVGMHKALPNSISASHSMNESERGTKSGESVYHALLDAQNKGGKRVYILSSHSHYYADNIFDTDYWRSHGGALPGWIVGTAGAHRYQLPASVHPGPDAQTNVYGYLLATAHQGGTADGTLDFKFVELHPEQVPEKVQKRFDPGFVAWCFANNRDPDYKPPACQK